MESSFIRTNAACLTGLPTYNFWLVILPEKHVTRLPNNLQRVKQEENNLDEKHICNPKPAHRHIQRTAHNNRTTFPD